MIDSKVRQLVMDALCELSEAIGRKSAAQVVGMFEPDAVMIGTTDRHVGADEIAMLVQKEVEQAPETMTWRWDEHSLVIGSTEGVVWFVVNGEAVLTLTAFTAQRPEMAMRLSGVLRQQSDGAWRWAQFHGSTAAG